jgi:hypothetical protein
MENLKFAIGRVRDNLNNNQFGQLSTLLVLAVVLAFSLTAILQPGPKPAEAYGETIDVTLTGAEQAMSLTLGVKTNRIGFARVAVAFDKNKVKLGGEVQLTGTMGNQVLVTSAADANSSGKIIVAAAITPANRTNAPTGTFAIATLPFTTVSTTANDTTVISITGSDTQIVEMHNLALMINPIPVTLQLNPQVPTATPTPGSGTTTLKSTQDAWVDGGNRTTNYGTDKSLAVRGTNPKIAYVKFDLSSLAGKTVKSAKLRMRICTTDSTCGSGGTQNIKVVNGDWTENGINYSNRPTTGGTIATMPGGSNGTWLSADVTASVAGKAGSFISFVFDQTSEDGVYFDSKENGSSIAPQLVVTY